MFRKEWPRSLSKVHQTLGCIKFLARVLYLMCYTYVDHYSYMESNYNLEIELIENKIIALRLFKITCTV